MAPCIFVFNFSRSLYMDLYKPHDYFLGVTESLEYLGEGRNFLCVCVCFSFSGVKSYAEQAI